VAKMGLIGGIRHFTTFGGGKIAVCQGADKAITHAKPLGSHRKIIALNGVY